MSVRDNTRGGTGSKKRAGAIACLVAAVLCALLVVRQMPRPASDTRTGGDPGGLSAPGTRGQITGLSSASITLQKHDLSAQTFALSAATRITVDQKSVAATDLKSGQHVRVVSADGRTADEVHARTSPWPEYAGSGYPGGG